MRTVLNASDIQRALTRMAHEIVEANRGCQNLVVLGIPTRGVYLANRLAKLLCEFGGPSVPSGSLDITLYRDDLAQHPSRSPAPTELPKTGIDNTTVILVDDVLCSGRTVRAALDALTHHGRPKAVRLAVLVDRGHRQFPIRPDSVGKNLPSAAGERVNVRLTEVDDVDEVTIHP